MTLNKELAQTFKIPLLVVAGTILYLYLEFFLHNSTLALGVILITICLGSYKLFFDTYHELMQKNFALDYLAILAIAVSLITNEYLVGAVIALMIATGRTLEEYGVSKAKASLTKLIDRIPSKVTRYEENKPHQIVEIADIAIGQEIIIRRGEVIPLDGVMSSDTGLTDESSLTGEPYTIEKFRGDQMRSGTVNIGDPIIIKVSSEAKNSAYNKIIKMVQSAQNEKAPMVRIADRYSNYFTVISLVIAGFSYYLSQDLSRVLAVLVIATPCPLILATPIALLGGMNAAAKKRIIIKRLAAIETLSRANVVIFDKTGTITIGKPVVSDFVKTTQNYTEKQLLSIAESIERNSLHPLAKAVVAFAKTKKSPNLYAKDIKETIGKGIEGVVNNKKYLLAKLPEELGMAIGLYESKVKLCEFHLEDEVKQDAKRIFAHFKQMGLGLYIFTGDKESAAEKVARALGEGVIVRAECSPQDKKDGIEDLKKQGKITAMVGDGINDAPALSLSDVGLVFSNEEQTAASEAADIVFLGGDFSQVHVAMNISKQTISIAKSSIFGGIGLALIGMGFASVGLVPPLIGAFIQEAIDVIAIVNALRASRISGA